MISHSKKFIFIHIPKSGGTSVSYSLRKYGKFLQGEENYNSIYFKHAKAANIRKELCPEFDQYYKFTIVRNPWDWVVSNYRFNRGLHQPFIIKDQYKVSGDIPEWAQNWSFEYWLEWWLREFEPSQIGMISDENDRILVDRIMRFETLQLDFVALCIKLKIWPRLLPHIYNSGKQHYKNHYNQKTKEMVDGYFYREIEQFGYKF